ncbi:MAG: type II secretion system F family protein [Candidatus Micrarchaeaceae archaeon]
MVQFERLISRRVVELVENELKLAGVKTPLEKFLRQVIISSIALLIIVPFALFLLLKLNVLLSAIAGLIAAAVPSIIIYALLETKIEQRKTFVESIMPDFLQIAAADIRSGIAIDKALVVAARPEFSYFSEDVKNMDKALYAGLTLQQALQDLGRRYRSTQLQHTIRMILEGIQYGGGMTDLLNQIAKDLRSQQTIEKEISGQLFLYTIFIAFAALVGAPVLYGLTSQMIFVTDTVWAGILKSNPGGLPTVGVSFLRPSPPKITIAMYHNFAIAAVLMITGFAALIVSAISSGSILRGIRYLPLFLLIGFGVFLITSIVISGVFASISGGAAGATAAI